jgi:hypothetical protein
VCGYIQSAAHSDFYDGNIYFSLEKSMQDQHFEKLISLDSKKPLLGDKFTDKFFKISIPLILIHGNLLSERYVVLYNQLLVIWKIACGK